MESSMTPLGDYINGKFIRPQKVDHEWWSISPANLKDRILHVSQKLDHVEEACRAAKTAFLSWSQTPTSDRKALLIKLKNIFLDNKEEMAQIISRETGKPLWETRLEAQGLANKIDITLNESLLLVNDVDVDNALPGVKGSIRYKPRGVMAVIGPFNFPAHLPNGHIIPALATGNTVVFKPSEWTPGVGQFMAQLIERAGFPAGVFNLVQGKGDTGERLIMNEQVDGVLFTGSYEVGLKIKQATLGHHWKILALEMGGKNASIVWNDADMDKAIYENILGAYSSSGQRCSCTSRLILNRQIADEFLSRFHAMAKKIKIGHWKDPVFMGPLINEASVDKYIRFQGIAKREGAEILMRGKILELEYPGYYVTPSINIVKEVRDDSIYQKTEIFGPNVAVYLVDDFEEAIEQSNSTGYGLVLSVFTQDAQLYQLAGRTAKVGLINWNRATIGASSRLPFGGLGKSGNHQPSAHFAVYYCTHPIACLEDNQPFDSTKKLPGLD